MSSDRIRKNNHRFPVDVPLSLLLHGPQKRRNKAREHPLMRHKANRCPNRRLCAGIARILKVEEEIGLDKTRDDAFHAQIQENRRKDDTESQQEKSQKAWNRLHIVGQERLYQNCQTEYDPVKALLPQKGYQEQEQGEIQQAEPEKDLQGRTAFFRDCVHLLSSPQMPCAFRFRSMTRKSCRAFSPILMILGTFFPVTLRPPSGGKACSRPSH